MSELSPEDRALVDIAGRDDMPDAGARDRVRRRLAARLGVAAGLGAATVATKSAVAMTLTTKMILAVAIVGLAGGGALILSKSATREVPSSSGDVAVAVANARVIPPAPAPAPAPIVATAPPGATPDPSTPVGAPPSGGAGAVPAAPLPQATIAAPRPKIAHATTEARTPSADPTVIAVASSDPPLAPRGTAATPLPPVDALAEETRLLRDANAATRAGQPARALALLDEHQRRFPQGVLAEERDAERVLALCAAGRSDDAHVAASRFLAARPRSALASRVRSACGAP